VREKYKNVVDKIYYRYESSKNYDKSLLLHDESFYNVKTNSKQGG
jgi:hypothetical protein